MIRTRLRFKKGKSWLLGICIECPKQPRYIVFEKKFEQWAAEMAG